jgi:hypothetical protein
MITLAKTIDRKHDAINPKNHPLPVNIDIDPRCRPKSHTSCCENAKTSNSETFYLIFVSLATPQRRSLGWQLQSESEHKNLARNLCNIVANVRRTQSMLFAFYCGDSCIFPVCSSLRIAMAQKNFEIVKARALVKVPRWRIINLHRPRSETRRVLNQIFHHHRGRGAIAFLVRFAPLSLPSPEQ